MADEDEPLPWDYFLTDYERDLLQLPIEDVVLKYLNLSIEQVQADRVELNKVIDNGHEDNTG